jgi:flagellar basal-body rod modification protein FlgD
MVDAVSSANTNASASSSKQLVNNYQTFLSLLTAQVQNQDPLSPMDTTEWTNQLVQYSSVEQAIKSNDYLEILANNSAQGLSNAASYVGKYVEADGNEAYLKDGSARFGFVLGAPADSVTLSIINASGSVVHAEELRAQAAGKNEFVWNGKAASGASLPEGQYSLSLSAKSALGSSVATETFIAGKVSSVEQTETGLGIRINGALVDLSKVTLVAGTD